MVYTETELKAKTVKDLKEIARELGAPAGGRKDELVAAILAVAAADVLDDGLGGADDDLLTEPTAVPVAGAGAAAAAAAGAGKHQAIVFNLDAAAQAAAPAAAPAEPGHKVVTLAAATESKEHVAKKANLAGIKVLSDEDRARMRAAKFGLAPKGGTSKPTGGKAAQGGGSSGVTGAGGSVEDEIAKLKRLQKFGKLSDADEKKLQALYRKQEAQKQKQQLAEDLMYGVDPDKMAARAAKFGGVGLLKTSKDIKDPVKMRARAEKFKPHTLTAASAQDDEARKKARLARFGKDA